MNFRYGLSVCGAAVLFIYALFAGVFGLGASFSSSLSGVVLLASAALLTGAGLVVLPQTRERILARFALPWTLPRFTATVIGIAFILFVIGLTLLPAPSAQTSAPTDAPSSQPALTSTATPTTAPPADQPTETATESPPTETPSIWSTPTPTPTPSAGTSDEDELLTVTLGEPTAGGDLPLTIHANTSLRGSDIDGENPGEPYFVFSIDDTEIRSTEQVERSTDGRFNYTLSADTLSRYEGETLTVVLADEDTVIDDEIATWSGDLPRIESPTRSTPTETPTSTSTPTPTPTPSTTPTPTPTESSTSGVVATVERVVDGDTVEIRFQNGTTDTVRLLGVDTPEVYTDTSPSEFEGVPDTSAGRECLDAEADDASSYMESQLAGEQIHLEFDPQSDRRGSYDRLLAYVLHDGQNINYQLVAQGYARVYDSDFSESDRFSEAENEAQASGIGVWRCQDVSTPTPTETTDGQSGSGEPQLRVADIQADAPGDESENLDEEYVTLENTGSEPLSMDGYTVNDEADHTYTFDDYTLDPGETVTLYTGSGANSDNARYWGQEAPVWNNDGDTVIVRDASGQVVLEYGYD